jgi:hypothetical protein
MSDSSKESRVDMEQIPLSQWLHQQTDSSDLSTTKTDVIKSAAQKAFGRVNSPCFKYWELLICANIHR